MDSRNARHLNRTPELWFVRGGAAGGGAKAHVDQHTESTMSLQLAGRKRWRVAPIAPRAAPHVVKLYQDGQIFERAERDTWNIGDVVLSPGDAVFFGPGSILGGTDAVPSACAASIMTWQFNVPLPTGWWRSFLPRIRFTPDLVHTWRILDKVLDEAAVGPASHPLFGEGGDSAASRAERSRLQKVWGDLHAQAFSTLPEGLRKLKLGHQRIIEDSDDLMQMPKKIRDTVLAWESEALALDAQLGPEPPGGPRPPAHAARHGDSADL
ncbi:unnamed protein product [Prorocentrum cordatum]|uniref:JmjC domain-containing protein n=1 Tax=Prorocentrum cordatum TaxID=2364126 RepID=A0ABN9VI85_9DINO|nr:unnamed protein product [Polarella glacialis]